MGSSFSSKIKVKHEYTTRIYSRSCSVWRIYMYFSQNTAGLSLEFEFWNFELVLIYRCIKTSVFTFSNIFKAKIRYQMRTLEALVGLYASCCFNMQTLKLSPTSCSVCFNKVFPTFVKKKNLFFYLTSPL